MVATIRGYNAPHPGGTPRWVIESNPYNDTYILKDGVSLRDTYPLIVSINFVCEINGRTYLEIERMVVKATSDDGLPVVPVKDGEPVIARETLFDYQAGAEAS